MDPPSHIVCFNNLHMQTKDEEASDGSRVWSAGGQRARELLQLLQTIIQCNKAHICNNEAQLYGHSAYMTHTRLLLFAQARYSNVKCNKSMRDSTFNFIWSGSKIYVFTFGAVDGVWQSSTGLWYNAYTSTDVFVGNNILHAGDIWLWQCSVCNHTTVFGWAVINDSLLQDRLLKLRAEMSLDARTECQVISSSVKKTWTSHITVNEDAWQHTNSLLWTQWKRVMWSSPD